MSGNFSGANITLIRLVARSFFYSYLFGPRLHFVNVVFFKCLDSALKRSRLGQVILQRHCSVAKKLEPYSIIRYCLIVLLFFELPIIFLKKCKMIVVHSALHRRSTLNIYVNFTMSNNNLLTIIITHQ